ncbi:Sirtuin catalytic domain profile [Nakaseomyces glabratus]
MVAISKDAKMLLTPPSSTKKPVVESNVGKVTPRRLFARGKSGRKPRLKSRPAPFTIFSIDDYLSGITSEKHSSDGAAEFLRYAFQYSKKIVAVVGAGISVAAGIPDFRSSEGLFETLKGDSVASGKELFDFNRVYSSDEMSKKFHSMIVDLHSLSQKSEPTKFHLLLDHLASQQRLVRLYTQNIDGLDTRLENLKTTVPLDKPIPTTIQLHGSVDYMECNLCAKIDCFNPEAFENEGEIIPLCPQCKEFDEVRKVAGIRSKGLGKLRPRVVLYNEVHPEGDLIGQVSNKDLKQKIDFLLIAGTSLKIPGVLQMCKKFIEKVVKNKGIVIYFNKEMPTQSLLKSLGHIDLIVLGDCQNISDLLSL